MAATVIIWIFMAYLSGSSSQDLGLKPMSGNGVCRSMVCKSVNQLYELSHCVVVVGNLQVSIMERTKTIDFRNVSFPNLREVTDFVVVYRVQGLESLGQLFPNLARIRGRQLLNNYALIVYDMTNLREVGLFGLLKIDRGGVIVWGVPQACFVETVDWKSITPKYRHVISIPDKHAHCNMACTCTDGDISNNHCWNTRKCQRFLEGPRANTCIDQCLGCRNTNASECSVCRYYTYKGQCVPKCPDSTIILTASKYCISECECRELSGLVWNNTCVFECPIDYEMYRNSTCRPCQNCQQTCGNLVIQTIGTIQTAEKCVYVNGSLTIHVKAVPYGMQELRKYLSRIEVVSDYVMIHESNVITSLDFLSSLRLIKGQKLKDNKYSLIIHQMNSLQTLFTPSVIGNLTVNNGTLRVTENPLLCMSEIDKIKLKFPDPPSEIDVSQTLNGYNGGCVEMGMDFQIRVLNETSALVMFTPVIKPDVQYSVLYVRLPPGVHDIVVPETCSDSEWYAVNVALEQGYYSGLVALTSLHPASTYAVCIEIYNSEHLRIARSAIVDFRTPVGRPEPPFMVELVASLSDVIVLQWVDHKNYRPHITHYELDVALIEINVKDVSSIDHCKFTVDDFPEMDYSRHAVVMRPPREYDKGCESMCGVLSSLPPESLVEEYFDICSSLEFGCNNREDVITANTSFGNYVRTLILNIDKSMNKIQVGNLAPFRDYRFRLRGCVGMQCSRSTRGVVRTLASKFADIPTIQFVEVNETGHITVKWEAPSVTNGPLLAYTVEIIPSINLNYLIQVWPQKWCVLSNQTNLIVKAMEADRYLVRVCSTSMAFSKKCSDWMKLIGVTTVFQNWWIIGVAGGIVIVAMSVILGCLWKVGSLKSDEVPLVSNASMDSNENDPPATDVVPFYVIPLRDTPLQ